MFLVYYNMEITVGKKKKFGRLQTNPSELKNDNTFLLKSRYLVKLFLKLTVTR